DQPAFFKNLCLNFQFPNGTQAIQTVQKRIDDKIHFKPFHYILTLLNEAKKVNLVLTKTEIGYYVLNTLEVLQGRINTTVMLNKIIEDRNNGIFKKITLIKNSSWTFQHISGQINLLLLANLIRVVEDNVYLNSLEKTTLNLFYNQLSQPLAFDIY